jgi:hypothetical protein
MKACVNPSDRACVRSPRFAHGRPQAASLATGCVLSPGSEATVLTHRSPGSEATVRAEPEANPSDRACVRSPRFAHGRPQAASLATAHVAAVRAEPEAASLATGRSHA